MLQSLELFGFKSFADRTLFEFAPGITCVVGPNGSGKSNVVDALKWILGDQSPKSLRGKEMADVIFNGASGRRGSGFAEAVLTFDNSQGLLPIDSAQVQIGRRLYQSGDSEYLLNGGAVRLKDIRDLFLGTGAGTAAYSVIEQGRVDQILQANPASRRVVFEEAAGISKFKSRRVDAERRLERVAQNLLRLTDIVDQVESQLNATRSQASKAARYREVEAELRAAWTGLAADDARLLADRLARQLSELDEVTAAQGRQHQDLLAAEHQRQAIEQQISQRDDQLLACERELAGTRQQMAARETAIHHQSTRRSEIDAELKRLRPQRFQLQQQVRLAESELESTAARLHDFERQLAAGRQEVDQRQEMLREYRELAAERSEELRRREKELTQTMQKGQRLTERRSALVFQEQSLSQNDEQLSQRQARLTEQLEAAYSAKSARAAQLEEAEFALQARQSQLAEAETIQGDLFRQRDELDRQLREQRERRSAAAARLAVLEELEQKQEGIAIGVRDMLRRAESSHYPPWNRILGLVRDLIEVPLDLAPIVDAALGERAQLVAVSDLGPLLDYLNRGAPPIEGRVGFISLQTEPEEISSDQVEVFTPVEEADDFTGWTGVYGRADRLVIERTQATGLATRVLGDTWIVESLDVARRILPQASEATRFVTLQGEVLSTDQRLFVGTLPHDSSIVSRKSELRQLKNEILQLARSIEIASERRTQIDSRLQECSGELGSLGGELQQLSSAVSDSSARLAAQQAEVERLEGEIAAIEESRESLAQEQSQLARDLEEIDAELAALQASSDALAEERRLHVEQMGEVEELLRQTEQTIRLERQELAAHEERLKALRETQTRLTRDQRQRSQLLQEIVDRVGQLRQAARRADLDLLAAESSMASLALDLEAAQREARGLQSDRELLRQERGNASRVEEQLRQERRTLVDRQHALEFEIQKQNHQLHSLADRIQEEFQISLDDLVKSEASAYRRLLEERYGQSNSPATEEASTDGDDQFSEINLGPSSALPEFHEVREELESTVDRLRRRLKAMGHVNTEALEGLEELETRFATLSGQLSDLREAKASLEDIIRRINRESQRIFLETFTSIRGHFQELFRKLFGGGDADILLEDPEDVLECGIEIVARPPGKELRSISLLSGGEKTLTAIALLFAMFKSKPSPYCILDEVDAALDEANVDRYVSVLKEFVARTQFVVITHRKRTMTAADVLYGVTMEQAGVSKKVSVRFEDVSENGEIRTAA